MTGNNPIDSHFSNLEYLADEISRLSNPDKPTPAVAREDGISVIVPSYQGVNRLPEIFRSLGEQSLAYNLFEVIVVLNGKDDGSLELMRELEAKFTEMSIRFVRSACPGASRARNVGLALSRKRYITFLDDDDFISPEYLQSLFDLRAEDTVAVGHLRNFDEEGELVLENSLGNRIENLAGKSISLSSASWLLGFNACKLVPASLLNGHAYDESLKSGEDVVFFAKLLERSGIRVNVTERLDAYYGRVLSNNSVSRKAESFDFSVIQRLDCVAAMAGYDVRQPESRALSELSRSQYGFVLRYLSENPDQASGVEVELAYRQLQDFPWSEFNQGQAKDLVVSYCFPPYVDTSASVAARVVSNRAKVVDVIQNSLSSVRDVDLALLSMSARWIDQRIVVQAPPSFSDWNAISDFAGRALYAAEKKMRVKGEYDSLYSRAMWIGSHVGALLIKARHPGIRWTAEFSDPLRTDSAGNKRAGRVEENETFKVISRSIERHGVSSSRSNGNLFAFVELATLLNADEVIFTNEIQKEYTLSTYNRLLREIFEKKSVIREHPSPPEMAYHMVPYEAELDVDVVNIAYFGTFYQNRGLNDVFTALANLPVRDRNRLCLHVFSNDPGGVYQSAVEYGLSNLVECRSYLTYLEFLSATKKFDVLLVNDVDRSNSKLMVNPFLPSKFADYRASGTPIWGIVDRGSTLDKKDLQYKSYVGDAISTMKELSKMAALKQGR